jgi:hypothetical protein
LITTAWTESFGLGGTGVRFLRARTSATFREILDAMWLFTDKFVRARAKFAEIKAQEKGQAR